MRTVGVGGLIVTLIVSACLGMAAAQVRSKARSKGTVPPPKWREDVLQVFFADAGKQLDGERPDFSQAPVTSGATGAAAATGGNVPAGGGFAWSNLVSAETLENEIKKHASIMAPRVATPGKFGALVEETRNDFSLVATVFGIIAGYDGDVRWKDSALAMRHGAAKAGFNCKVASDASFKEAKARHAELAELIGGSRPSLDTGPDEPELAAPWAEVTDLTEVMKRMKVANEERLKPAVSSKQEFGAKKDEILHEAQLVAALAQVIQDPSYIDDEEFRSFAKTLQEGGGLEMAEAAKGDNFEQAEAGNSKLGKACNDCHGQFQ